MKQVSKMLFALIILLLGATGIGAAESALAINIAGSSPDGYQLTMTIPYKTGMSSDFSDIRFYADNPRYEGGTALSYYVEDYTASTQANVTVPIPVNTSVIYCGWDISGETTSESNGYAVFDLFDDCDGSGSPNSSIWTTTKQGSSSATAQYDGAGNLVLSGYANTASSGAVKSVNTFSKNLIFEF